MRVLASLAAAAAVVALAPAAAQDSPVGDFDRAVTDVLGEDARLIVGGGLGVISQPYLGADDIRYVPEPLIIYQNERFEFIGRTLGYELWSNESVDVAAIGEWRFFGHDAGDDSPFLEGMSKRKGTAEAGLRARFGKERLQGSLAAKADILSRHGGYELEARASYELSTWRPLSVRPNGGVRYQSDSLADYYFGVDPEEALNRVCTAVVGDGCVAIDRPAYETGAAVTPFVGVTARQSLTPKVAVVGGFDHIFLADTVQDSPIVDASGQTFAFLGMIYVFGNAGGAADAAH